MNQFAYLKLQLFNNQIWNVAKALIEPSGKLFQLAVEQARLKSHFTMASSQSGKLRNDETKYQRQLMGCLAEIYAEEYLNELLNENNLNNDFFVQRYDNVRTDGFKSAANEYDLKICHRVAKKSYLIEFRSSIVCNRSIIQTMSNLI